MTIQLAKPINNYFEYVNSPNYLEAIDYFAPNAVVFDEGRTYHGRGAIESWLKETRKKYQFSLQPISVTAEENHKVVVTEVSGNFPGSPIQLSHAFILKDEQIQSLEILSCRHLVAFLSGDHQSRLRWRI